MTKPSISSRYRKKSVRIRYDMLYGLLLISPWIIGVLVFKLAPILASLGISFTDFYMLSPEEIKFTGLENLNRLLHDRAVGYFLFETIALALTNIPLQIVASVLLATLLSSERLRGRTALRTLFFIPSIIPSIAILFMWFGFIDPATGWLNRLILAPLGLTGFNNVFSDAAISFLFAINSLWAIGPGMLIMLGAMQGLPPEITEAARVDGAGPFVRFFNVTLPLISPALFFALVINMISIFGGVVLLDRGTVFSGSISPFDGYISYVMFNEFELGYASSLAWVFFAFIMVFVIGLFSTSNRWVYYPDQKK